MLKDMINARPTSRGLYLGLDHTSVVQTLVQTFGLCTRVWTDTCVDTTPRTPLSDEFVSSMYIELHDFLSGIQTGDRHRHRFVTHIFCL